eukprot:TRINITY_DN8259_c0_g1_i1.p1 TRINITY_DN8259_c0_g1~~TRINITY_DN8259_c0_g1_i1.p1  ORF type:complete len:114 (+),score=11.61 TRINITY_DN8259_c0_g1_i1:86-427(+)
MSEMEHYESQDETEPQLQLQKEYQREGSGGFDLLPREVWAQIVFYAASTDIACISALAVTCRSMSELIEDETMWRQLSMKLPFYNVEEKISFLSWKEWYQYLRTIKSICKPFS